MMKRGVVIRLFFYEGKLCAIGARPTMHTARWLMVAGNEVVARASKSTGERYRQTWLCTIDPIEPAEWPATPRDPVAAGSIPLMLQQMGSPAPCCRRSHYSEPLAS